MRRQALVTAAALLALGPTPSLAADAFTSIAVFGDSHSDDGNSAVLLGVSPIRRFTTNPGLTAAEYIAQHQGLALGPSLSGGTDYAIGGAFVWTNANPARPTLTQQVQTFLAAHQADPRGLYILNGGTNDAFHHAGLVTMGTETIAQANAQMAATGTQLASLAAVLQDAGAGTIVVFNLPLGLSPSFNAALNDGLKGMTHVVAINNAALLAEIDAQPARFGLTDITGPACTTAAAFDCTAATLVAPDAAQTHVFADTVHFTTAIHTIQANLVDASLAAPGQVSLLAEAPLSAAGLERTTIQRALDRQTGGIQLFADIGYASDRYSDDGIPSTHGALKQFMAGALLGVGPTTVGGALTVSRDDARMAQAGRFGRTGLSGSLFARLVFAGPYVEAGLAGGSLDFTGVVRTFDLGVAQRSEHGATDGYAAGGWMRAGWPLGGGPIRLDPFVGFSYQRVHVGAFAETSGDASAMFFGAQNRSAEVGEAGLAFEAHMAPGLSGYLRAAYNHDFTGGTRAVTAGTVGLNGTFSQPAFAAPSDWLDASLGLEARLRNGWAVHLAAEGRAGGRMNSAGVDAGLRIPL